MSRKIFILFLTIVSVLFAQSGYTIEYHLRVYHLNGDNFDEITTAIVHEGDYIKFPDYQLSGDIQPYQDLYNVIKGSTFRFEPGALSENIKINLCIMSFDQDNQDYYFDDNLFAYIGAQVQGQRTGFHDFDDTYQLQNGKAAYWRIPKDNDLNYVLDYLHIRISEIDFAYHTRDGYTQEGIDYTELTDSLECKLTHFSKFGGGRGSVLPVEMGLFDATIDGNSVNLQWRTATEVNNYGFEVQRQAMSNENSEWETIGFVEGAGNSNSPKSYSFTDNVSASGKYSYRLKQIDLDGSYKYSQTVEVEINVPLKFELSQNYPNPFNPTTTIMYSLPVTRGVETSRQGVTVSLQVFNSLGQKVATLVNREQAAGNYTVQFDARDLPSGVYFYTLRAGDFVATKKMILMK